MASTKTITGLVFALLPIAFCAGLVYYFMAVPGQVAAMAGLPDEATKGISTQLGPTVVGVSAIGLLCAFAFVLKIVSATTRRSSKPSSVLVEDDEPFDADAALARYMARKAAGGEAAEPVDAAPATPVTAFGRKSA